MSLNGVRLKTDSFRKKWGKCVWKQMTPTYPEAQTTESCKGKAIFNSELMRCFQGKVKFWWEWKVMRVFREWFVKIEVWQLTIMISLKDLLLGILKSCFSSLNDWTDWLKWSIEYWEVMTYNFWVKVIHSLPASSVRPLNLHHWWIYRQLWRYCSSLEEREFPCISQHWFPWIEWSTLKMNPLSPVTSSDNSNHRWHLTAI